MRWVVSSSMTKYPVVRFLIFWAVNTLSLWVADELFDGISFTTPQALFIAGLILGVVNTFLKPLLVILTLPSEFAARVQQGQGAAGRVDRADECANDSSV